jgi:myo-inositol-1(or 4)-monophosphatase
MATHECPDSDSPDPATLTAVARTAADLANAAGRQLSAALPGDAHVSFKPPSDGRPCNSNPVSRIDRDVEHFVQEEVRRRFPDHAVLGEELAASRSGAAYVWVIDPLDGTTNFINGLPLFACSIGVLYRGRPVAGAIWCSCSHALAPGTYHAMNGGPLRFNGSPLERRTQGAWRGLAAEPGSAPTYASLWDTRVLATAALESAYVAAGLLRIAYIPQPRIWDVVAGLALLASARCRALVRHGSSWDTMLYFPGDCADLSRWSEPLLLGAELDLRRALGGRNGSC